jgi:tetratricopeptide (TPR) repeat protein
VVGPGKCRVKAASVSVDAITVQDAEVQRFGRRFRVLAEAGTGGMATVYRAADLVGGHDVALKVLHETAASSAERFGQEAALLAELTHPAIVRYVDHGITALGERYLAMEWLEGRTLEDRLAGGPIGILDGLRLGRRLLEGLAVAHRKGIVHRDLKPANVFLPGGDLAQAKLLDFGIARRTGDVRRMTTAGASIGTPAYMSPEQVKGLRTTDARSDLFSLGSVLYECITGEAAFEGDTPLAVLARICLEETVSVAARRPELPPAVAALLTRMLAKDPDERPASAVDLAEEIGEVIEALGDIIEEHEPQAGPPRDTVTQLATDEQRLVSAIVVSRVRALVDVVEQDLARMGTWDVPTSAPRRSLTDVFDGQTFVAIEQAVAPFGARVNVFLGNALAVTLVGEGTPSDLANQAARCVLALKGMLPRVCFAVSTGRAVVGDDGLSDLVADTARLLSGGAPGDIRLDDVTAGLLEARFEVRADPAPVEGPRHRQLLFEKGLKEAPRTVLGKEVPCIGREREVGSLLSLWVESSGEPVARAMLVTSPPGGGKSRVRHELVDRIQCRSEPFTYLIGRGDSIRAGAPFAILGPALRAAAGLVGGEPAAVQQKRLCAHVERHIPAANVRRVAAFLGEIADVRFLDDDLPQLRAARQDPRLMADQTLGAWLDYIEAECAAHPVLLVFEDLQWGDVPSVQFVDAALRRLTERPLMVLAFARPEVNDRFPGLWADRNLQRMALAPLTAKSAQKLVQHILADLPAEKAAWIVERANGNPFYLEELVRASAAGGSTDGDQALPDTVIGMVQARFDALGADAKRVLRAASIFGNTFRPSGVRCLVGDEDRSLDQWLDILAQKELVFPRQAADTREFVFRHALFQEAAYAMLAPEDCTLGHRLAGEYLEREGEHEAIELVEHFEKGGEASKAAHWCRFAAEQALDANDLGAVIERVERGVRLGAEGEGLGLMRVVEAQARFWRAEYREGEQAATEAKEKLVGVGRLRAMGELIAAVGQQARFDDVERLADEVCAHKPDPDPALMGAWLGCLVQTAGYLLPGGRYVALRKVLGEVEAAAQSLEPASRARREMINAWIALQDGHLSQAVAGFQSAANAYEALGDVRSATEMLANVGGCMGELGMLEAAEATLSAALDAAEHMHIRMLSTLALLNLCIVRANLSRFDEARSAGNHARELSRQQGDLMSEGFAEFSLSMADWMESRFSEAESHARNAARLLENVPLTLPSAFAALAQALLGQGKTVEGLAAAEAAYRLLQTVGRMDGEELIRVVYAECLFASGDVASARSVIQEASRRLDSRAAAIQEPASREAFTSRLPSHARTLELASRIAAAPAVVASSEP